MSHGRAAAAGLLVVLALSVCVSVSAAAADQCSDTLAFRVLRSCRQVPMALLGMPPAPAPAPPAWTAAQRLGLVGPSLTARPPVCFSPCQMFLHTARSRGAATGEQDLGLGLLDAFFASLSMIVVSEIGDETFIIAALMAMRHPKSTVLSGALSALVVMTVLSTGLGRIVPNLISRKHTNSAATGMANLTACKSATCTSFSNVLPLFCYFCVSVLYAFFGLRLLYIAWRSDSKASQKKEIEEVEEKLEAGQGKSTFRRVFSRFCTPIFLESFVLTFLAEWGDRSQIATIVLATHKNAVGVATGATLGHTICTSIAVVGGSMLASKISQGTVATIGGLLFLGFSLSSYFYPPL
ncbi:hypothetical protein HU200_065841 [Digitaria exilis]|uniref:GDT1 family protein n=1 Tax=Digitaria exilis TaxID=1010633 RepID=A0A835A367_9POAL|nr:hypothetical protein HU200_065841 [Digitaria exilis]